MPAYILELIVVGLGLILLLLESFLPRLGAKGLAAIGSVGLLVVLFLLPSVTVRRASLLASSGSSTPLIPSLSFIRAWR